MVKIFAEIEMLLRSDLVRLSQLRGEGSLLLIQRIIQEQKIGRVCFQAEEYLDRTELFSLQWLLGIDAKLWQRYKLQFIKSIIIE